MTDVMMSQQTRAEELPTILARLRIVALALAIFGLSAGMIVAAFTGEPLFLLLGAAAGLGVTQLTGY